MLVALIPKVHPPLAYAPVELQRESAEQAERDRDTFRANLR